jgi:hypothetical protein
MIVPQFWAEGRLQHLERGRQITVRRFGWSDASEADAQAKADARAQDALDRLIAGEELVRREPRRAYNGAEGVPIREEIVSRHGDTIITRNAYGARCLNTPDVLFVDIDSAKKPAAMPSLDFIAPLLAAATASWAIYRGWYIVAVGIGVLFVVHIVRQHLQRRQARPVGSAEDAARERVAAFVARNPEWRFRLYKTPAGLRALAMHRTFQPDEPAVAECFEKLGADPIYARMCFNQGCFRARVSAKPWRIGMHDHIRPRTGAWPVAPEHQAIRSAWIESYEQAARNHSSCRFLESIGSRVEHPSARTVQALHDELCRANTPLPSA